MPKFHRGWPLFSEPIDNLAVERLLNSDVAHARCCRRLVPMLVTGWTRDHIARTDFPFGAAPALGPAAARGDDQPLAKRMGMPCGPGAGLERHQTGADARRLNRLKQRIDPHIAGEIFRRSLGGRL